MSTFVLVHGGWSGGWTWEKVFPLLEESGHKVEAPDLPGHGEDRTPIPEVSLQRYADRISEVLDAQLEPVVLVGHSSGGQAISQAAEQRPEKVKMLVYLAAYLLHDGESVFSVGENDTESLILPNLVMSEDGSSATIREEIIKEGLLHDCSDEDVERAKSRFVPQALAPLATPITVTEDNFGRVPRVYIETCEYAIGGCGQRRRIGLTRVENEPKVPFGGPVGRSKALSFSRPRLERDLIGACR